jgi:hypothetical protein
MRALCSLVSALLLLSCDQGRVEESSKARGDKLVERTLLETLRFREQHKTNRFDAVIRELARLQCGYADPVAATFNFRGIDELFPSGDLALATGVQCGRLIMP